eukprot:3569790-Karenia_brevis.AAC.1
MEIVALSAGTQWIGSALIILATIRTKGIDKVVAITPSMHPEQFCLPHDTFNELKDTAKLQTQMPFSLSSV